MTEQKDHAKEKPPPPVLLLLHVLGAFLLNWLLPLPFVFPWYMEWLGYLLVFVGLGFAFSAIAQFGKLQTTLNPHGSVSVIVTGGPYRFSRNPIYLGFVCTLIGLPLAIGNYWGVILSPLFVVMMYQLVIKQEESYLEEKFKDVYTSYKSSVRRWL